MNKKWMVILTFLILSGCDTHTTISAGWTKEVTPPEVMGPGGVQRETQKIEVKHEICTGAHSACTKPTKEEIKKQVRDLNIVMQQVNTYSTPINNKILVNVFYHNQLTASAAFDTVVVGNQFRFSNVDHVADWLYNAMDNGNNFSTEVYLDSTGFGSEVVTAQIRSMSTVLAAASGLIEIDCGSDHPWSSPAQGCVIVP